MDMLPPSIVLTVVILTAFLIFATALTYAVRNTFLRTRLLMSSFFMFIVATLSVSFWHYTVATLPYTVPAFGLGIAVGYFAGVRAAEQRLRAEGVMEYMQHFAHIHITDPKDLTWWSLINFYTVMGALVLINLIGLTNVIFQEMLLLSIATCVVGAFLLGTIIPYLIHLWSISPAHHKSSTRSDA